MPGMLTSSRMTAKSLLEQQPCSASSPERAATIVLAELLERRREDEQLLGRSSTTRMSDRAAGRASSFTPSRHPSAMQPGAQHGEQLLGVDRLGQVVPGARLDAFSRSPFMALAVTAMIGRSLQAGILRISRIVSMPSISGIMMSISTMSMSGSRLQHVDRVAAVVGRDDHHVVLLEHRGQREDVADVVVDDQHLLAGQQLVRAGAARRACGAAPPAASRRCWCRNSAVWSSSRSSECTRLHARSCRSAARRRARRRRRRRAGSTGSRPCAGVRASAGARSSAGQRRAEAGRRGPAQSSSLLAASAVVRGRDRVTPSITSRSSPRST